MRPVVWIGALLVVFCPVLPVRSIAGPAFAATFQHSGLAPLPATLTAVEAGLIERHRSPKARVDESLKVAATRLVSAVGSARSGLYEPAAAEIVVFASLISYANLITRAIPAAKKNDRENCLKKIEQAIFRQTPRLEAVIRDLPFEQRETVSRLGDEVRRIRLQALNDLLGGGSAIKVPEER